MLVQQNMQEQTFILADLVKVTGMPEIAKGALSLYLSSSESV